jgi:uncharacterized protein with FMN-binding domain
MKNTTRTRIAAGAIAGAMGLGAVGQVGAAAQTVITSLKDGTYTGKREYAYYGYVKLQAIVKNGKLSDVKILEYPSDNGRSRYINSIAIPYLIQEAVDAQTYKIDLISGATFSSSAFVKSLTEALKLAGA